MLESGMRGVEGERQIEGRDFLKVKEELRGYLKGELRRANNFVVADEQSRERRDAMVGYLGDLISALEQGRLSPVREFFVEKKEKKEETVAAAAAALRRVKKTIPPQMAKLEKRKEEAHKRWAEEKKRGDTSRMVVLSKEIGSIENQIATEASRETEMREDLDEAQNDPDLERFTSFVAALDEELTRRVREK
jgi:hypothetical protein